MVKEFFDLLDVYDHVVGKTTKKEAHENGHIHRVAAVFVFDENENLLVQLRTKKKDGLLDHSVGGHIRAGESYGTGALRELKEELGIKRKKLNKIGIFLSKERRIRHYFGVYEARLRKGDMIVQQKKEMDDLIPLKLKDVRARMQRHPKTFTMGFIQTFNFYLKKKRINIPQVKKQGA